MKNKQLDFWIGPSFSNVQNDWETSFLKMEYKPLIIGLSGPTKSGKTILAKQLSTGFGFQYVNLSMYLEKLARQKGVNQNDWRCLYEIAVDVRKEYGNNVLAKQALREIILGNQGNNKFVIDGIFHPDEVRYLKEKRNFFLIWIDVDFNLRVKVARNWYKEIDKPADEIRERDVAEQLFSNTNNGPEPNLYQCLRESDEMMKITEEEGFNAETVFYRFENLIKKLLLKKAIRSEYHL